MAEECGIETCKTCCHHDNTRLENDRCKEMIRSSFVAPAPAGVRVKKLGSPDLCYFLQSQFFNGGFTRFYFSYFASNRHREAIYKFPVLRNFVVCYLLTTKIDKIIGGYTAITFYFHPCHYFFAIFFAGYANYLHISNCFVCVEKFFNLSRVNIFPPAQDHI